MSIWPINCSNEYTGCCTLWGLRDRRRYCSSSSILNIRDHLVFEREPDIKYDPNAIRISSASGAVLGYVPRCYSDSVSIKLLAGVTYSCAVIEVNKENGARNASGQIEYAESQMTRVIASILAYSKRWELLWFLGFEDGQDA